MMMRVLRIFGAVLVVALCSTGATAGYTFGWEMWDRHQATELAVFYACASPELQYLPFSVGFDHADCMLFANDYIRTGGNVDAVSGAVGAWLKQWEGEYDRYELSEHDCRGGF